MQYHINFWLRNHIPVNRVFSQLPDLTFLSFLYKIDITGFQNQQKKIASTGYWTHNTNPTIRIPAPLPTQPICQSMPASNFQTLLKPCSIKPEMIKVQFMNLLFNRCLGGWVVKGAGNLRVGLVLWVQCPVEVFFFADSETPWCQFCTRMTEMSDLAIEEKLEWKRTQNRHIKRNNIKKRYLTCLPKQGTYTMPEGGLRTF